MKKHTMQVHIDRPLIAWVRGEAARRGVSQGEVIREAIRRLMDEPQSKDDVGASAR